MDGDLFTNPTDTEARKTLHEKLTWLMLFRVIVAAILLITGLITQVRGEDGTFLNRFTTAFYILAGLVFFLSLIYIPLVKYSKRLVQVAASQLFVDSLIITFVVYISGGASSPLSFLYILTIISASIVAYQRGGFLAASLGSFLYGVLAVLEYHKVIPTMAEVVTGIAPQLQVNILYNTTSNIVAFYLVAFLSGYLATQARLAQEQLWEQQIDYRALEALNNDIVRSISSGLMTINNKMQITSFNSAAELIAGRRLEQVYGQSVYNIFPFLKSNSMGSRMEAWFAREDGERYFLGFSISPLRGARGEKQGDIIIFQDLTQLKEMERELKTADRLAAVGKFAAGIAHEVRNPLASISGSVEILKGKLKAPETEENQRLMDIVIREVDWLDSLIAQFLDYAKPSVSDKKTFEAKTLIDEIVESFRNAADNLEKGISISCSFAGDSSVVADRNQIKQVLWNLIKNAVDACGKNGTIDINTQKDRADKNIVISVSDSGMGIPDSIKDDIFSPFITSKNKGSGLGLPIAHKIIESHQGQLTFRSIPGETTFTITLPLG
ncbi:MAG: PAS domain S-box protein [Proteobacteria bacterium]|nr:PAS domain S-box protein [Pseudomonadota bacterium]